MVTVPIIHGPTVDHQTRCKHYHTWVDIVAIKMKCCGKYYPCYKCHNEFEDHAIIRWQEKEFDEYAIVCGVCNTELTIRQYKWANYCPYCHSRFNDGCGKHYDLYFEVE
jgi:uncharacterized CHY-type Zn-finger protein